MTPITIDSEFKELIPSLSSDEYQQLEANIKAEGCRDALVIWAGKNVLLDGHNRYEICQRHGLPYRTVEREFDSREDVQIWIIQNQFGRRNLTPFVRSELALKMKAAIAAKSEQGKRNDFEQNFVQSSTPNRTNREVAKLADVSHETIRKVETVVTKAPEQIKQAARAGEISTHQAYEVTRALEQAPEPVRQKVEMQLQGGIVPTPRDVKALVAEAKREEKRETVQEQAWASGKYNVVYADPPWRYEHVKTENRAIENQYPTMALKDICNLPVSELCADDVVLFMWATSPKLEEAMQVVKAWGFTYRTCAVWVKDKIGMGYYFRQKHELLLVATRGNLPVPEPGDRLSSVIEAPRGRHSEKPDTFYEIIEQLYPNYPKIELFSRNVRTGWQGWGNEYAAAA